jgi:DNA-binding NtrC family response regulator
MFRIEQPRGGKTVPRAVEDPIDDRPLWRRDVRAISRRPFVETAAVLTTIETLKSQAQRAARVFIDGEAGTTASAFASACARSRGSR